MGTIERCLNQISLQKGYFPGKKYAGDCKICNYDPQENKKCPCYTPRTYETAKS